MHLVVGNTGPVALRLIESLLGQGKRVAIISSTQKPVALRTPLSEKIECFEGEETSIDFGLPGSIYQELITQVEHVYLAPAQDVPQGAMPESRLVRMAAEVCEFVRAGGAPQGVSYLSSLLVFGNTTRPVAEDELAVGQSFSDSGEEALATAEKIIHRLKGACPFAVVRVGAIVGDEREGLVFEGSVLAQLEDGLHGAEGQAGYAFVDLPTRWETVDRAADALLLTPPAIQGNIVHLVDSKPLTDRQLVVCLGALSDTLIREREGGMRLWARWTRVSFPFCRAVRGWGLHFQRSQAEEHIPQLLERDEEATLRALFRGRLREERESFVHESSDVPQI